MQEQANQILVLKLTQGRAEALNTAYNLYFRKMHIFCKSYIRDAALAEDIEQEAFLTLWEKRENLLPDIKIGAYLLTIVINKALDVIKHQKIRLKVEHHLQSGR